MEIILINDSKLKIMLDESDLRHFELKASELDYMNTDTKRMFWDLLSRAKHETGFDTDGQRVLVRLYPSKDGGCEMFVTKIGALEDSAEQKRAKRGECDRLCSEIKKNKAGDLPTALFSAFQFERIEHLVGVCRRLLHIGYIGESSAYLGEDKKSYLFLSDVDSAHYTPLDEFSFISEYGKKENSEMLMRYLSEHGSPICESRAVATLGKL